MRLSRMEIYGFKSFGIKTALNFATEGITAIVGPNGCGKSNLIDALRWALGEQSAKNLRGKEMQDVIFAGTPTLAAANFCEVNLFFSQAQGHALPQYSGFQEIVITRRISRKGESAYFINQSPCRLMDVRDLFLDTGLSGQKSYSIVEQGSISNFLMARPVERRRMIDEAAGVLKYKHKKEETLRRLSDSSTSLLRLQDRIAEWQERFDTLKVQAEKAEEYFTLQSVVDRLESQILVKQWHDFGKKYERAQAIIAQKSEQLEREKNALLLLENQHDLFKTDELQCKEQLQSLQKKMQLQKEHKHRVASQFALIKKELELRDGWKKNGRDEQAAIAQKIEKNAASLAQIAADMQTTHEHLQQAKTDLQGIVTEEKEIEIEASKQSQHFQQIRLLLNQLQLQNSEAKAKVQQTEQNIAHSKPEFFTLDEAIAEQSAVFKSLNEERVFLEQEKNTLSATLEKLVADEQEKMRGLQAQQEILLSEKKQLKLLLNEKASIHQNNIKLQSQLELWENSHNQQKIIAKLLSENPNFAELQPFYKGQLQDFFTIDATAPKIWLTKIEPWLGLLVFKSGINLLLLVQFLKKMNVDALRFVLWEEGAKSDESLQWPQWLHWKGETIDSLHPLLQDTHGDAVSAWQDHFFVFPAPIFHYCDDDSLSPIAVYLEKKNLLEQGTAKNKELQIQANRKKDITAHIEQECAVVQKQLQSIKQNIADCQKDISLNVRMLEKNQQETANVQQKITAQKNRWLEKNTLWQETEKQLMRLLQEQKQSMQDVTSKVKKIEQDVAAAEPQLSVVFEQKKQLQKKREEQQLALNNLQHSLHAKQQMQVMLEKDQEEKQQQHKTLLSNVQEHDRDILQLQTDQQHCAQQNESLAAAIAELETSVQAKERDFFQLQETIYNSLKQINDNKETIRQINSNLDLNHAEAVRWQEERDLVEKELFENKKLLPQEVLRSFEIEKFQLAAELQKMKAAKIGLIKMQDVNLAAGKEFKEVKEKLTFFLQQKEDLSLSVDALHQAIAEIDLESEKKFKAAFAVINEKFQELFPVLFGGGEAYLSLLDQDNLLESGVDVFARPPGKKIQNLNLLSGGEKAMSAIALIIAIFHYKPSPFCILDEVDAPLDIENVRRFNDLVKALSLNSQIILITHNANTIEVADYLYGVTMEEPGVSRLVAVRLDEHYKNNQATADSGAQN